MHIRLTGGKLATLLVGALFVAIGVYGYAYMGRFLDNAREATATVVSIAHESAAVKKGRMHPTVRFTAADGREIVGRTEQHHNVQVGERVQIVYDPRKPDEIEITTLERARKRRLMFVGFSVLLGLGVCGAALKSG